jgi:heat shock protein HslJ
MSTPGVPRRHVLTLGAAVLTSALFATTSDAGNDGPSPSPAVARRPDEGPTPASTLTEGVWRWQRTDYADGTTVVCSDPGKYTLTFLDNGIYSVQADCNQGSGAYTVAGSQLTLQPGPMTRAACPPGSQDTVFLRDLGQVATHVFDGENLVLNLRSDSGNMVFSPQPPVSLTGPAWQVLSVNNGRGAVVSVVPETQLDATFGESGIVGGNTGCNTYRGLYTVTGATIAFGSLITTRRACLSEAAAAQEQAFLAALGASTRYELRGDRLTLRDDAGAAQVDLVRPTGS